ncbi:MAG: DUF5052 family protein [Longicatena sp.]|nr:DUF5052 family protein [Longicatena sp.]
MKKIIFMLLCFSLLLTGCSLVDESFKEFKGELVGNDFTVKSYDNYGNLISKAIGDSVELSTFNEQSFLDSLRSQEQDFQESGSSVIEVLIDGEQMISVGNTMLFIEDGIDYVEEFEQELIKVDTQNGLNIIGIDRLVNRFKNAFGKGRVVVVCSQLGIPIAMFEGDKVRVTIPNDLPKTTRITIDGKSLYIHRANFQIFDTDML